MVTIEGRLVLQVFRLVIDKVNITRHPRKLKNHLVLCRCPFTTRCTAANGYVRFVFAEPLYEVESVSGRATSIG